MNRLCDDLRAIASSKDASKPKEFQPIVNKLRDYLGSKLSCVPLHALLA